MQKRFVFITGSTGYIGSRLIPRLLERGHEVRALVRNGSEQKLPQGCFPIFGNALDSSSFINQIKPADTFVQLVGVAHPSPAKANEFKQIDLVSVRESVAAAKQNDIQHFIYLSVAQPAPIMKAYQVVRAEGEKLICESGMNATFIRPWYVLGPGHYWAYALKPLYWIAEMIPSKREQAKRMGLATIEQMIATIVFAVENPASGVKTIEAPAFAKQYKKGK
jgi:uncharacterized protein YbjT (DUF2867 family)